MQISAKFKRANYNAPPLINLVASKWSFTNPEVLITEQPAYVLDCKKGEIMKELIMKGVREHSEGMDVLLTETSGLYEYDTPVEKWKGHGRLVIRAFNEAGFNNTQVDLLDIIVWIKTNRPDLLNDNYIYGTGGKQPHGVITYHG
jgi:hypothetical protein